eukprot:365336-Chlamydomonas_euryale.AAC.1
MARLVQSWLEHAPTSRHVRHVSRTCADGVVIDLANTPTIDEKNADRRIGFIGIFYKLWNYLSFRLARLLRCQTRRCSGP